MARERILGKYGNATRCRVDGKLVPGTAAMKPREYGCLWELAGGALVLIEDKSPLAFFTSDAEKRLQQQGF
jgi:hypothetical protein